MYLLWLIQVSSIRMQGLLLLFFSKLEHVLFIRDIQVTYTRTGLFGYWVRAWQCKLAVVLRVTFDKPNENLTNICCAGKLIFLSFKWKGNKGGVSICLSFYGHMLCFLNCHLTAHMNYASQRVDEFQYILDAQTFDTKNTPRILDHKSVPAMINNHLTVFCEWFHLADCVIPYHLSTLLFMHMIFRVVLWFGDLNFRIEDHGMLFVRNCITSKRYNLLWSKDQVLINRCRKCTNIWIIYCICQSRISNSLNLCNNVSLCLCMSISHQLTMMKPKEATLRMFEEGPLDFQPTYKFDLNSDNYDTR